MRHRQQFRVDDRDAPLWQHGHGAARHGPNDRRRGRFEVAQAHHHPRAQCDRRKAGTPGLEHHPLGLPLRPGVGGFHAMEVPRREFIGGLVRSARGQGVQGGRVDETLDTRPAAASARSWPVHLDIDGLAGAQGDRGRERPSPPYGSRRGRRAPPGVGSRHRVDRRSPNRWAGRPAPRLAAAARAPARGGPRRPAARAIWPPTNPPAPVTSTGHSDGSGSRRPTETPAPRRASVLRSGRSRPLIVRSDGARSGRVAIGKGTSAIGIGPGQDS